MSFKLHIFTHDQDNVQIPSIVSIIVYNMYLEASEMCVWGVTTSLTFTNQPNNSVFAELQNWILSTPTSAHILIYHYQVITNSYL